MDGKKLAIIIGVGTLVACIVIFLGFQLYFYLH